ncbi:MAG: hypothetical protein HY074_12450 [Deltaproteobacteria bacterium]|nr:hypothetical protein [Deltaproteobacteria bacterium]
MAIRKLFTFASIFVLSLALSANAFAIDKRLKLMFKTAGYGAAGGLVIGAGTMAMGMGGFRNVLMGTSAGLYAGIALAAYIIATPNEDESAGAHRQGPRNPYQPRKPVGPDDYDEDDDGLEQHLPPKQPDSSLSPRLDDGRRPAEVAVWAPIVSLEF